MKRPLNKGDRMKFQLSEFRAPNNFKGAGAMCINMEAETLKDAAWLTRLARNGRPVTAQISACASEDGTFTGTIYVKMRRNNRAFMMAGSAS